MSPDGRLLVTAGESGQAHLWDLRVQLLVRVLDLGASVTRVGYVAWLPSGRGIISLGDDGEIVLANVVGKCRVLLELSARNRSPCAGRGRAG